MVLRCPICEAPLTRQDRALRCQVGHCFDMARQGYVNLLPVQQKHSKNPGDTREQVLARRAFLEAGYYAPIADALCEMAGQYAGNGPIFDVGCGEGYYSTRLAEALNRPLIGLDISKEAVRCAAAAHKGPTWLCGTAAHLPVEDHSVGLLTSLFALTMPEEFRRVLAEDGCFFQVLAQEDHLLGLKSLIYPELKHREKDSVPDLPGFALVDSREVRFTFTLEGQQVQNLLYMTPHVYRIGAEGAARLRSTQTLTDSASCRINCYRPL